jgi:hypothetical protein
MKSGIHEVEMSPIGRLSESKHFSLVVASSLYQILTHDVSCFQFHTIITYFSFHHKPEQTFRTTKMHTF